MPPGSSADRAACSRPDAGPRLSGGRSGPPPGGTGGRTGRSSPATTRQRPGADRGSTPTPAGSLHGFASQLTTRPVQQRQIALQRHRQEPAVAGSTSTPRTKLSSRGGGKVTATKSGDTPRLSTWKTIPPENVASVVTFTTFYQDIPALSIWWLSRMALGNL